MILMPRQSAQSASWLKMFYFGDEPTSMEIDLAVGAKGQRQRDAFSRARPAWDLSVVRSSLRPETPIRISLTGRLHLLQSCMTTTPPVCRTSIS